MDMNRIEIPSNIKAFIFDLDGTIADTMPLHFRSFNSVMSDYGITVPVEMFLQFGGMPVRPACRIVSDTYNQDWDDNEIDKISIAKQDRFEQMLEGLEIIKPVADVIERYKDILPMSCGTGNEKEVSHKILEQLGLKDIMPVVVTAADVTNHKPHPETFLDAAKLMGIAPEDCLVFEDAELGFQAAEAAGMQYIDVTKYYTVKLD